MTEIDIDIMNELCSRLPKTKDGVTFIPGMGTDVYHPDKSFINCEGLTSGHPVLWDSISNEWKNFEFPVSECYYYYDNLPKRKESNE